eukprot:Sspe_Gene.60963::Locus_33694_Transcript_1_1_Confidence_1.000_Length_823::g.60963::m.60963
MEEGKQRKKPPKPKDDLEHRVMTEEDIVQYAAVLEAKEAELAMREAALQDRETRVLAKESTLMEGGRRRRESSSGAQEEQDRQQGRETDHHDKRNVSSRANDTRVDDFLTGNSKRDTDVPAGKERDRRGHRDDPDRGKDTSESPAEKDITLRDHSQRDHSQKDHSQRDHSQRMRRGGSSGDSASHGRSRGRKYEDARGYDSGNDLYHMFESGGEDSRSSPRHSNDVSRRNEDGRKYDGRRHSGRYDEERRYGGERRHN